MMAELWLLAKILGLLILVMAAMALATWSQAREIKERYDE